MRLPLIVVVVVKLAEFLSLRMPGSLPLSTISSRGKGKDGGGSTQLSQRASIASATTCSDGRAATEDRPLWDDDIPLTFIRRILCRLHGISRIIKCPRLPAVLKLHMEEKKFRMPHLMHGKDEIALGSLAPRGQNLHGMGVGLFSPSAAAMDPGAARRNPRVVHFKWAICFGA